MKRWPTKPLGEVAQVTAGDPAPQRAEDFSDDGLPFVRMQDVGRFGQTICLAETKDRLSASASPRFKRFPAGSILVPKSGASIWLNHRAVLGMEAHVVSHLAVIVPRSSLDTRFAYYWLCATDLAGVAHQADLPSMKTSDLAKLHLPVPPMAEQKRIVKLLDEADGLRKLRAQADCRSADLVPALFHEMFGDPEHTQLPVKSLVELVLPDRPITYGILKPGPNTREGVPYVRVLDIKENRLHVPNLQRTTKEIAEQYRRSVLRPGDILVTIRGTVGRTCIVPDELNGANITQDTARLAAISAVDATYLIEFLNTPWAQAWMGRHMLGQAVKGLNLGDLRKLPVPVPSRPLQREFAQRVAEIRELESGQAGSRERLDGLFQSMLHRAFNGEL